MELKEKHCWAEIDIDAIKSNYELIKYIMDKPFYTVLNADAYRSEEHTSELQSRE